MTTEIEKRIFADFRENVSPSEENLSISFTPGKRSLQKRWENNCLSADFIADYFRNFYISKQEELSETSDESNIENLRDAVKYIANELLENAMKFQAKDVIVSAKIVLALYEKEIIFYIQHGVTTEQALILQAFIENLLSHDAQELYLEAMRSSAKEENLNYSGMGLLSIICDHNAKLGWKIQSLPKDDKHKVVTTMTSLFTGVES